MNSSLTIRPMRLKTSPSAGVPEVTALLGGSPAETGAIHRVHVPEFLPLRGIGGHGHTLLAARRASEMPPTPVQHRVRLADGETIVLHENFPPASDASTTSSGGSPVRGRILLMHGLAGSHNAPYMGRFVVRLLRLGFQTFRLDMRGCGAAMEGCQSITHAGRSDDVLAAIETIAKLTRDDSPIGVVGVSLGGNQLLRAAGRVGAGLDPAPAGWDRVAALLAVAPPIDLRACSDHLTRWSLRPYNRYFVKRLLSRLPAALTDRAEVQAALAAGVPKTLRAFDRQFTAPLAGFACENDYYDRCSAAHWLASVTPATMIVAAQDDPLIPAKIYETHRSRLSPSTRLLLQPTGGHVGFLQARRTVWTDDLVESLFAQLL